MIRKFSAPVTKFTACEADLQRAIDAVISMEPRNDGSRPVCLRVDLHVSHADSSLLIKASASLFVEEDSGEIDGRTTDEMDPELKQGFANFLLALNDDAAMPEMISAYPLPWTDFDFSSDMKGRYLSVLFLGNGIGAVIQEYLPSWMGLREMQDYLQEDATAETRAEVMSLFLPDNESEHQRLKSESLLCALHPRFAGMFTHHCDFDLNLELAQTDLTDIF